MAKGDIHTVHHGDRWVNEVEGGKRPSNSAPTKAEAQAKGRAMAIDRGVEHVIHKQNGQIDERHTYPPEPGSASFQGIKPAALRRPDMSTVFSPLELKTFLSGRRGPRHAPVTGGALPNRAVVDPW